MEQVIGKTSKRQRIIAVVALLAYLGFAVWTFALNDDVLRALNWFIPVSILMWFVLRWWRRSR